MQDNPTAIDVLDTVIGHLRNRLLPTLEGRAIFEMRVTLSALELVRREFTLKPASDAAELGRLGALLGSSGDLESLNSALCLGITSGEMDVSTPGLLVHLFRTELEKLAVDQPNYGAYKLATGNPAIHTKD